jgi:hypothetical protein
MVRGNESYCFRFVFLNRKQLKFCVKYVNLRLKTELQFIICNAL